MKKDILVQYHSGAIRARVRTLLGAAALVALSACGAAEAPLDPGSDAQNSSSTDTDSAVANGCSAGQYSIHGSCVTASSFLEACQSALGLPVAINGIDVCKKTTSYTYTNFAFGSAYYPAGYWYGGLGGDYSGTTFYGLTTILRAEPGDVINYRVTGSWGYTTVDSTSVLGLFNFYTSSTNCRKADGNGDGYSSSSIDGKGYLVISDGTTTTPIPSSQNSIVATSSGLLRVGFAIENYYANQGACGSFTISQLSVSHCEDEAGNTQSCQ
jgi:hypothetical protein